MSVELKAKIEQRKQFQEVLKKVREHFAFRLEDLMTDPSTAPYFTDNQNRWVEMLREGRYRLPPNAWSNINIQGCFHAACDDLRIDRDLRDDIADAMFTVILRADKGDI